MPRVCFPEGAPGLIVNFQSAIGILCDIALFAVPVVFTWRNLPTGSMKFRVTILLSLSTLSSIEQVYRTF